MNILSSFAAVVTATLIGITAESAWSDEATPNAPAKPAARTAAPATGVAPGWYPPPPVRGGYTRPWQQPSQWPVPPQGYGQLPPHYPPPGQYRATPAAPATAVNPLSAELKQAQEQLTAKRTELDIAHTMLEQLRGTLQHSIEAERTLREKVADITSAQQALQARVTELTAALNTTTATLEQHQQQITNDQEQTRTLTAERDRLHDDLASRDEELATVQAELQAATQALEQAQAETSTSSQQLSEARSQAETFNIELTELKAQVENQKTTRLDTEQTRTEERDSLHSDLASRDEQLATVHAELQAAREALQQAQAETFNNELIDLKAQLDSQEATWLNAEQTRTLTAEHDRLQSDLASRDERLATVQAELQAATQTLQQAQSEASTSGQQLSEARSQAETFNNELTELRTQLENQKTTLLNTEQTLAQERDSLRSDLANRDEQLATVHADLQVATQALQQAQAEASNSGQQLSEARSQAETFNNELTELKTQLESQKTMALDKEQTLATVISECDGLQENLAACSLDLTQAQAALTDVQSVEDALRQAPPPAAGGVVPFAPDGSDKVVEPVASEGPGAGTAEVAALQTTDTDEDGVPDSIDLCPETQPGIAVDTTGCTAGVAINLEGVNFLYNSHELTDKARHILDRVADVIIQQPRLRLEVAGHTDATGDPTYNQGLSMQRAEAVRDYLVAQGVNPKHIGATGYGGQRPIADNTTSEGLRKNRRVELRILQ
jgi:outer membrane protein OmpA-like peptidoglycan-associated protein